MVIDFFALPVSILFHVCNEWITLTSLGRLDSATCRSDRRPHFLQFLCTHGHVFSADCCVSVHNINDYLNWVVLRNIKVSKLHLAASFSPRVLPTVFFTANGHHLRQITSDGNNQDALEMYFPFIQASCCNIEVLVIKHSCSARWVFKTLVSCQTTLHTLVLTDSAFGEFDATDEFHCPMMQTLRFNGQHFAASFIAKILHACPNLENLSCCKLQSDGLDFIDAIGRPFDHLHTLDLSETLISDAGLHKIVEHCSSLTSFTAANCTRLTNVGIISLTTHCPGIEEFVIGSNAKYTDLSLNAVASTYFATLTKLSIGSCFSLTGNGIANLMRHCSKLKSVDIRNTSRLTETHLLGCIQSCKQLEELLLGNLRISDELLCAIADNCPHLRRLSLEYGAEFAAQGMWKLLKNAVHLEELVVSPLSSVVNDLCIMLIGELKPNLRLKKGNRVQVF